jgi:hypothetical protein
LTFLQYSNICGGGIIARFKLHRIKKELMNM